MKRYLILIPTLSKGGAEAMAYQYGKYLQKDNLVTFCLAEKVIDQKFSDVNYFSLDSGNRLFKVIFSAKKVRFHEYDYILSLIPAFTIALLISRPILYLKIKNKLIFTIHNPIDRDFLQTKKDYVIKKIYLFLLKRNKNIFSVSKGVQDSLLKYKLSSSLLYNISKLSKNIVNRESSDINILMVGRLTYQKGYDRLETFIEYLENLNFKYNINIYGEGPEKKNLILLKEKYPNKITLNGYCPDIGEIYSNSKYNCLLLLSRYEGFGLVLLEAISKGIYCISTNCESGPLEILSKSNVGSLIPENFNIHDVKLSINNMFEWNKHDIKYKSEQCEQVLNFFQTNRDKQWKLLKRH